MTYTKEIVTKQIITPSSIYTGAAKERIQRILLPIWKIDDFRAPVAADSYIIFDGTNIAMARNDNETAGQPRFIVSKRAVAPIPDFPEWE